MNMKSLMIVGMIALLVPGVGQLLAQSQADPAQDVSLGDLARELRSKREKAPQKPAKVFTNDNLPARPAAGGLTVAAQMSPAPSEQPGAEAPSAPPSGSAPSDTHDEAYYQQRTAELRSRLQLHQRELAVLEQKLAQNRMQYYPDPQKTLMQEYTRSDINKLMADIEKKKQQIKADEQAFEDLRDQLRREGGPAGWLR